MKTYKERTIEAIEELIYKYNNPFHDNGRLKLFFDGGSCPLCKIYITRNKVCDGCLMGVDFTTGCTMFYTFNNAYLSYKAFVLDRSNNEYKVKMINDFRKRAKFFVNMLPHIKEMHEECFHPDTWSWSFFNLFKYEE